MNSESKLEVECANCNRLFDKAIKEINRSKNNFCSRRCAAIFNNTKHPKRSKLTNCKCGKPRESYKTTLCSDCKIGNRKTTLKDHFSINNATIEEVIKSARNGLASNRYGAIRHAGRQLALRNFPHKCFNCGYDKHVESCHKKPIKDFPKETLINIVNSLDNLVLLCPNCHWEFDNGLLEIKW